MSAVPTTGPQPRGLGAILTCSEITLKIFLATRPERVHCPAPHPAHRPHVTTLMDGGGNAHGTERG